MGIATGWLTTVIVSQLVLAQLDLGTARNGDLVVDAGVTIEVNSASGLVAAAPAGTGILTVFDPTLFKSQQLLLLVQMQVDSLPAASDAGIIDLDATPAGQYEFARVLSVSGAQVALTQPLAQGFIERSQAVVVPEFRSAVVDGTVSAPAWNGSSGGIVAMLVAGELKGTGTIAASGAGFRPPPPLRSDGQPCLSSWVPAGVQLGAAEGLLTGLGWGPAASPLAGGSAGLGNGSGGGGSHIGMGGGGSGVGDGQGGQAVRYGPLSRLIMGGGGGLAGAMDDWGEWEPWLARGGGVVFIRADRVLGTLAFGANAINGYTYHHGSPSGVASGAGGGLVRVETNGVLGCASASANGSNGRSYSGAGSPGGGGGGGRVVLVGSSNSCPAVSAAGIGGSHGPTLLPPLSANATQSIGDVQVLPSGSVAAPVILSPASLSTVSSRPTVAGVVPGSGDVGVRIYANGLLAGRGSAEATGSFSIPLAQPLSSGWSRVTATAGDSSESPQSAPVYLFVEGAGLVDAGLVDAGLVDAGLVDAGLVDAGLVDAGALAFQSPPVTSAECGVPYDYSEGGAPRLNYQDGLVFSVEGVEGQPLPPGLSVDSATGVFHWVPTVGQRLVPVRLVARRGAETAQQVFAVQVACPMMVGCGCGSSTSEAAWLLLALLPWRAPRAPAARRSAGLATRSRRPTR
jgi:hypothetical protein